MTNISTPPAVPRKTRRSAASNTLSAMLGAQFLCGQCGHWHAPSSRLIKCCQRRFANRHLNGRCGQTYWHPDIDQYDARRNWRLQNTTWTDTDQETYDRLTKHLHAIRIIDTFGPATLSEITLENGHELLQQRYAAWHTKAQQHIAAAQVKADGFLAELNVLFPPPYPAGPPQYEPYRVGPQQQPTAATQAELDRAAGLTTPPMSAVIDRRHGVDERIRLRWSLPRPDNTDLCHHIARLFSVQLTSWEQQNLKRGHLRHSIDRLGLDPAFWSGLQITMRRITLFTHPFTPAPLPAMTPGGQLALPFAP